MLLMGAALSILMGVFVAVFGQEKRVKPWFLLLCVCAASICVALRAEVHSSTASFLAARVVMTSALLGAAAALLSARTMCNLPFNFRFLFLLFAAALINVITVWLSNAYFTGNILRYRWGWYVEGNPNFVINPVLVAAIGTYALVVLWSQYRHAQALDKNRTKYIFAANLFLASALLDYLPHFGIDLFGGPISGIAIPLFLAMYGYAMLRYRLFEFRAFVGRVSGWLLATIVMATTYGIVVGAGGRLALWAPQTYFVATIASFVVWLALAQRLPGWAQRMLSGGTDFASAVEGFADSVVAVRGESELVENLREFCLSTFSATTATFVDSRQLEDLPQTDVKSLESRVFEKEIVQRRGYHWPGALSHADLLLPVTQHEFLLGAIALGSHADDIMYSNAAIQGLTHAANIFGSALTNIRGAVELVKRHQLDRYLAPQIVDSVLAGRLDIIERKRRATITVFFSDLQNFSELADRLDPEVLSFVLNEYISNMADIAFAHGGTVDKFIGDAIMVLFGAPLDEDPCIQVSKCLRMALAMHGRTITLNQRWLADHLLETGLISRMGIHIGEATVGSFGSRNRQEFTAIGRTVNLASRLEQQCTPGCVLVSEEFWRHLAGQFPGESRGKTSVKGFASPIEVFEIDPRVAAGGCIENPAGRL